MEERRRNAVRRAIFDTASRELRGRLALVCAHLGEEELARLTARMTRLRLKYENVWDPPSHGLVSPSS